MNRLRDSVIRPLAQLDGRPSRSVGRRIIDDSTVSDDERRALPDAVWRLAKMVTAIRAANPAVPGLAEAAAALQDLTLAPSLAAGDVAHARKMTLASLQSQLRPQIQVMRNGPYPVTNPATVRDWLGESLPTRPQMALCRCGGSMIKPACDGSHARNGFRDAKDPNRVPDRRDHYAGQQIDLLDNRGTCQHAGYCTDRLSTVFHAHHEPFVTASSGDAIFEIHASCLGR